MESIQWDVVNRLRERFEKRIECERTGEPLPEWAKHTPYFRCLRCDKPFRTQPAMNKHYLGHPPLNEEMAHWRRVDAANARVADERHWNNAVAEAVDRGFRSVEDAVQCALGAERDYEHGDPLELIDDIRSDGLRVRIV